MFFPTPRGNMEWWGYCSRGQNCVTACDSPKDRAKIGHNTLSVKRGEEITVQWKRQNHPGGFVRLAFVPWEDSDNEGAFDASHVKYACYETNCKESEHQVVLGDNNGPGDGMCSTAVQIPKNLPDGEITLQWMWFGGGIYYAQQNTSFANYVSCADLKLSGGEKTDSKPSPVFKGGDAVSSTPDQCRYWSTNSVHDCPRGAEVNTEGCGRSPVKFGSPKEWESAPGHTLEY